MLRTKTEIGPADRGRAMLLAEFDGAEGVAGHRYELGRGVVVVNPLLTPDHDRVVAGLRRQFDAYSESNPGHIYGLCGYGECKFLVHTHDSVRYPDLAVYRTTPPDQPAGELWAMWVPEIVIEVVAPETEYCDYVEKCEEYLQFGATEYWAIDGGRREMLVHRRRGGRWAEHVVRATQRYRTRLLPGFEISLATVFGPPKPVALPSMSP